MDVELLGVIGREGLKPKMTWDWRRRNGQVVRVPFIRFSMFVEDKTRQPVLDKTSGKMRRPREIWQVILPENERGQKLFEHLYPGRQVFVKGRMTANPGVGTNREGQEQLYANLKCRMNEIQFLDSPPHRVYERHCTMLRDDLKVINAEQYNQYMQAYKDWEEEQIKLNGPPREVEDKTRQGPPPAPEAVPDDNADPDVPEFSPDN